MEKSAQLKLSVGEFLALLNQTLEFAYPGVMVEGEVVSFKVSQGKFVFFDLKDSEGTVGCFMTVWQLRMPIEDGMKVVVQATPKVTPWGKFSLTVQSVRPSGEGDLRKSFELLKAKLANEGLFAEERKRPLPRLPQKIAVISSTQAAGYADFIKILGERWGGLDVQVAHTQVQGEVAPDQMIRAIEYFNAQPDLAEVLVLIRGGGSADDLAAYNDERLVRAIAGSRIPTLVGVGHETDTSLADLAADVRAATPSNAAQILVPDKRDLLVHLVRQQQTMIQQFEAGIDDARSVLDLQLRRTLEQTEQQLELRIQRLRHTQSLLGAVDPAAVLQRGYAIVRGAIVEGTTVEIETLRHNITAEVQRVTEKI